MSDIWFGELAGKEVEFSAGGTHLCDAFTDAHGWAECPDRAYWIAAVATGRVAASFAGGELYEPSSGGNGLVASWRA